MTVTVTTAAASEAPVFQNLFQLYTHDFSEFWAGTTRGNLLPDGRFEPYPLDDYWKTPAWSAWMIWNDAVLAGFALLNDHGHLGKPVHRNMAEFFVLRKHRGQGVGRIAAEILFLRHPGSWEVAVARKNLAAQRFWRRIIQNLTHENAVREDDLSNEQWNGPVFSFSVSSPPAAPRH